MPSLLTQLRESVRKTRMYSGDAMLAAEEAARQLEFSQRVIDKLRVINPDLVAAAEAEVRVEQEADEV